MSIYGYFYLEIRRDTSWQYRGDLQPNPEFDLIHPMTEPEFAPVSLYHGTNSVLFSLLGFTRYPISDPVIPAFSPRGLPPDASTVLRIWAALFDAASSHSWVSIRELAEFDWQAIATINVFVKDIDVVKFLEEGNASVQSVEMRHRPGVIMPGIKLVTWQPTYAQAAGQEFMQHVIERLVGKYGPTESARLLYWFA